MSGSTGNLAGLLEASARRAPDALALVAPDGATLTYGELDQRASRLAGFLRERGVRAGDRVGLCLPKGRAAVTAIFGTMKARAVYVPVDPHGPAARNATILEDCQVSALLLDEQRDDVLAAWRGAPPATIVRVMRDESGAFAEALAHPPLAESPAPRRADELAYVLYTSGSTGVPKGVMVTHGNALAFVDWCSAAFEPRASDRFSGHAPFHFDLSVFDLYVSIQHGAALFLIGEELGKDPKGMARFAAGQRLTIWYSTPSVLALMAELGGLASLDLSALRHVLFAGEVFPVKQLRRLTSLVPHAAYWNLYGPTETNVCAWARIPLPVAEDRTQPYPIGALCPHCEGAVLDEQRRAVARGSEGVLWIAGPSLFQGYWKRPELDAGVFMQRDGRRWYDTGDVVREEREEGYVFVGRKDRMVKRRGYRVELGEIEAALHGHPGLREVAVVALPDSENGVTIRAHVAAAGGGRPSLVELKRFCAAALPGFMSPDRFVFHDALPRTSTGKVDHQALLGATAPLGR